MILLTVDSPARPSSKTRSFAKLLLATMDIPLRSRGAAIRLLRTTALDPVIGFGSRKLLGGAEDRSQNAGTTEDLADGLWESNLFRSTLLRML